MAVSACVCWCTRRSWFTTGSTLARGPWKYSTCGMAHDRADSDSRVPAQGLGSTGAAAKTWRAHATLARSKHFQGEFSEAGGIARGSSRHFHPAHRQNISPIPSAKTEPGTPTHPAKGVTSITSPKTAQKTSGPAVSKRRPRSPKYTKGKDNTPKKVPPTIAPLIMIGFEKCWGQVSL